MILLDSSGIQNKVTSNGSGQETFANAAKPPMKRKAELIEWGWSNSNSDSEPLNYYDEFVLLPG
jgi:hypothetical protein